MSPDDIAKIKNMLDVAASEARTLELKAMLLKLPDDLPAWFAEAERLAMDFPLELPHRSHILGLIDRARRQNEQKDSGNLRITVLLIQENWDRARHEVWAENKRKFNPKGRGPGPIRKWITKALEKRPNMKNQELWNAFKAKPLRGFVACDNSQGRYIEDEKTGETVMEWRTFMNVAALERGKITG